MAIAGMSLAQFADRGFWRNSRLGRKSLISENCVDRRGKRKNTAGISPRPLRSGESRHSWRVAADRENPNRHDRYGNVSMVHACTEQGDRMSEIPDRHLFPLTVFPPRRCGRDDPVAFWHLVGTDASREKHNPLRTWPRNTHCVTLRRSPFKSVERKRLHQRRLPSTSQSRSRARRLLWCARFQPFSRHLIATGFSSCYSYSGTGLQDLLPLLSGNFGFQ